MKDQDFITRKQLDEKISYIFKLTCIMIAIISIVLMFFFILVINDKIKDLPHKVCRSEINYSMAKDVILVPANSNNNWNITFCATAINYENYYKCVNGQDFKIDELFNDKLYLITKEVCEIK